MSELRREPILQRWVAITYRPWEEMVEAARRGVVGRREGCPFCPGNEAATPPEIYASRRPDSAANTPGWTVRVVPNKFPFLRIEGALERSGEGIYDRMTGVGAHEIVIETPSHDADWWSLPHQQVVEILGAYRSRHMDLRGDIRFRHIILARNHGPALALLPHPHSHVLALPVIPKRIEEELRGTLEYDRHKERCLFCDILKQEMGAGTRIIGETPYFLAFAPFASRYPLEICVIPKPHEHDFGALGVEALHELAGLLQRVLGALARLLPGASYSLVLHSSPLQDYAEPRYHWHVELRVRLPLGGGFEWATGFLVNPLAPEEAARLLREAAG